MMLLAGGLDRTQIAAERGVTVSTVRGHLSAAYKRLGVSDGVQAVAVMYAAGWLGEVPASATDAARIMADAARVAAEAARTRARALMPAATAPKAQDRAEKKVSPAQRLYLRSFDRLLALRHTDSAVLYFAVLKEMTHHLRGIYYELERLPPWEVMGAPRPPGPVRQHSPWWRAPRTSGA